LHKLKEASLVIDSRPAYHRARTRPAEREVLALMYPALLVIATTLTAPAEKTVLDIYLLLALLHSATH
jgi:hypothetical protein